MTLTYSETIGTMSDTSPGTVFLLAAMWTTSNTFSTLEPSLCERYISSTCDDRHLITITLMKL